MQLRRARSIPTAAGDRGAMRNAWLLDFEKPAQRRRCDMRRDMRAIRKALQWSVRVGYFGGSVG